MSPARASLATASAVLLIATLTACGGDDATATDESAATTGQQGPGPAALPGASGEIAAIDGRTMQVQSATSGQVAVSWTARTSFTEQVETALAEVKVGSCVVVESDAATEDGEPVAATAVRITDDAGDGCGGFGGGPQQAGVGERPEEIGRAHASVRPSDLQARLGGTAGEVVAVAADRFTVSSTRPGDDEATAVEVTVDGATTYTRMAEAGAAALEVGRCASATGETDSTGAVTADRISVTDPVDGQCGMRVLSSRPEEDR